MLKGKLSLQSVAGEVTAGVGTCTLLGMKRACDGIAGLELCWL